MKANDTKFLGIVMAVIGLAAMILALVIKSKSAADWSDAILVFAVGIFAFFLGFKMLARHQLQTGRVYELERTLAALKNRLDDLQQTAEFAMAMTPSEASRAKLDMVMKVQNILRGLKNELYEEEGSADEEVKGDDALTR